MDIQKIINKKYSSKIIASALTIVILGLLIISGPVLQALELQLSNPSYDSVQKGEKINFEFTLKQDKDNENLNGNINLFLDNNKFCEFDKSGNIVSGCTGINITEISALDYMVNPGTYGYGYGYSYGYGYGYGYEYWDDEVYSYTLYTYNIEIDSEYFSQGNHSVYLTAINKGSLQKTKYTLTKNFEIAYESGAVCDSNHLLLCIDEPTCFASNGYWYNNICNINEQPEADQNSTINFPGGEQNLSSGLGIDLEINATSPGAINITKYSQLPTNASSVVGLTELGIYFTIEADSDIINTLNSSIIKVYYSDAQVSALGIDESTLRLYYYNETSGLWTAYNSPLGGVDTTNNYVWAKTDHFSLWAVFGSLLPVSSVDSGSSSGGSHYDSHYDYVSGSVTPTPSITNSTNSTETNLTEDNTLTETNQIKKQNNFFSGITGAVTGTLGKVGTTGIIIFIIAIFGLSLGINALVRKKIKRKGFKKSEEPDFYKKDNSESILG
ncbi:MAG: hypothetical protein WCX73_01880 [Candidatus Pacearchaeota archaeon]|jgi:hypothetical protein